MGRHRAIGIVVNEEKILIVRRILKGHDYCVFPGGGIEENETPEIAALREVHEETSINTTLEKLLYRVTDPDKNQYFFLCTYISGIPVLDDPEDKESMAKGEQYYEPKWISHTDLFTTPIYPLEIRDQLIEDISNNFSGKYPIDITVRSSPF